MSKTTVILVVSFCFICVGILLADVNVTGNWDITISTPRGERTRSSEFIQDGEKLTVIAQDREGNKVEAKGSVKGDDIEWTLRRQTPRGTFEMHYKGKIEGDSMKGTVSFGSRGSGDWSAERSE
jgi:hypothetical protein